MSLFSTLVVSAIFLVTSIAASQELEYQIEAPASEESATSRFHLGFAMTTANGTVASGTNSQAVSFTTYSMAADKDFFDRLNLRAELPIVMGSRNGDGFSEFGNPFLGARLKLLKLQDFHPLWFSVHGGVRFSRPEAETIVAAQYQEYLSGASLVKSFDIVDVITEGTYVTKVEEAMPGLDVGNEMRGYGGLRFYPHEDWALQSGYLVRHADPLRFNNEVLVGEATFTALEFQVMYHLSLETDIVGQFNVPLSEVVKNRAAFGDLSTQGRIARSWSLGFQMNL